MTKLYEFYNENPTNRIIYICFGFKFETFSVKLEKNSLIVFSPQLADDIYVNKGNNKIQFKYQHKLVERTREQFLELLKTDYDSLMETREKNKEANKDAKRNKAK